MLPAFRYYPGLRTAHLFDHRGGKLVRGGAPVSGQIGVKEIERLIRKLELDKEILAEQEEKNDEAAN